MMCRSANPPSRLPTGTTSNQRDIWNYRSYFDHLLSARCSVVPIHLRSFVLCNGSFSNRSHFIVWCLVRIVSRKSPPPPLPLTLDATPWTCPSARTRSDRLIEQAAFQVARYHVHSSRVLWKGKRTEVTSLCASFVLHAG